MTHHNVISAGDAARMELARQREQQPSPGEVLWALIGASVAMWAIILKLVGVL
jgi:hypothetical protein